MSSFPQIGTGSVAQFPLTRSRRWRAIQNNLESGEQIMLPDPRAGRIEWQHCYQELTVAEVGALNNLFSASQGSFGAFTFIDPLANLLAWSEDFSKPDWQFGLLQNSPGVTDPLGTHRAWSISNSGAAPQSLSQTLDLPGEYVACFSVYLRSNVTGTATLVRDGTQTNVTVGPVWRRAFVNGSGVGGDAHSSVSIAVAPGQTIEVWGLQVEAQPWPSVYRQTGAAEGAYLETYFEDDELIVTSTSPGLASCRIGLISRV